jgi:hypothetical protein
MSDRLPTRDDVEDFEMRARATMAAALRADDPDITDEELAAILDRAGSASIVAARVRDDRHPVRRTGALRVDADHYQATPEGLRALRRDLLGGPGGPPSGQGLTWDGLVAAIVECWTATDPPIQEDVAGRVGKSARHVQRVAGGRWQRAIREAAAIREGRRPG